MQVATLFRETATLLGASMEAQDPSGSESQGLKLSSFNVNGEMALKQEPHDDGYETSGDLAQEKMMMMVKREPIEDPYSFVDDDPTPPPVPQPRGQGPGPGPGPGPGMGQVPGHPVVLQALPKKRGRKKKICQEGLENTGDLLNGHETNIKTKMSKDGKFPAVFKERKKHDRFNGMPEEEVSKRTLPDHLSQNLDIIIVGINPGLFAAYKGHHYAGPGNHFWKCLYLSGLTAEPMTADDDFKLQQVGIGFTNMVSRATKGSADLTRKEIKEGSQVLLEKLQRFKPKIAVFNGKLIYEVFSGKKDFSFGRQPEFVEGTNTYMWVMPSSSARCAQLPRAADKVPFYAALKKFRDYLNGIISDLDESDVVFTDSKLKHYFEREPKEPVDQSKEAAAAVEGSGFYGYGRLPNNGELTDLSNAVVKKDDQPPIKKKRGRPKKIKCEGDQMTQQATPAKKSNAAARSMQDHDNCDTPKKKRGRPKKLKTEENGHSDHTNSSATLSTCFSPPIQSPGTFNQSFSSYNTPNQAYMSQSPSEPQNYHQSPAQSQHYSQSPQPPSQPFTHSDLSSEISAAISSEHNLGSPSPASPSLAPPDFDPPASMGEQGGVKEDSEQYNSPGRVPTTEPDYQQHQHGYQQHGYQQQQAPETEDNHGGVLGYTPEYNRAKRNLSQDVSSKSLSGLESLVDQIPSIAEGEVPHGGVAHVNGGTEEEFDHSGQRQYSDEASYLSSYPAQYNAGGTTPNYSSNSAAAYSLHHSHSSMNFSSVSSLANSSASEANSFSSVSSLAASNYATNSYPNLHPISGHPHPHMMSGANAMGPPGSPMFGACGMMPGYPYGQYPGASTYPGTSMYPHMPSPNYPYPSPYSNSSYPQPPSYLPNHVLDRIKQDRMDIGFGSF